MGCKQSKPQATEPQSARTLEAASGEPAKEPTQHEEEPSYQALPKEESVVEEEPPPLEEPKSSGGACCAICCVLFLLALIGGTATAYVMAGDQLQEEMGELNCMLLWDEGQDPGTPFKRETCCNEVAKFCNVSTAKIEMKIAVEGLDYASLSADATLQSEFEDGVELAIRESLDEKRGAKGAKIDLDLSSGSVIAAAKVSLPQTADFAASMASVRQSLDSIAAAVVSHTERIPGISAARHGNLSVEVEKVQAREKEVMKDIVMSMTVEGMNYAILSGKPDLQARFEQGTKKSIQDGMGLQEAEVELELSEGTNVKAVIKLPEGSSPKAVLAALEKSLDTVGSEMVKMTRNIPNIGAVIQGSFTVVVHVVDTQEVMPPAPAPAPASTPEDDEDDDQPEDLEILPPVSPDEGDDEDDAVDASGEVHRLLERERMQATEAPTSGRGTSPAASTTTEASLGRSVAPSTTNRSQAARAVNASDVEVLRLHTPEDDALDGSVATAAATPSPTPAPTPEETPTFTLVMKKK